MAADKHTKFYRNISPYLRQGDTFVNIGANDGISNDPIGHLIEPFALKGLAVEPVATTFKLLEKNYRQFQGRVTCVRAAICAPDKRMTLYRYRDDLLEAIPRLSQGSSLEYNQMLESTRKMLDEVKTSVTTGNPSSYSQYNFDLGLLLHEVAENMIVADTSVPCYSFDELMALYDLNDLDILSIDAEGHDFELIQTINLDKWRPAVIVIETCHFNEQQQQQFKEKMQVYGYSFLQRFKMYADVYVKQKIRTRIPGGEASK